MKYLHIKNLDKYHPGYKDRDLKWCKISFSMVTTEPEFLMMPEIDRWRYIEFIILELQMKKPVPLDEKFLTMKGFDLKKRSISLTLAMLQNFTEVLTDSEKICYLEGESKSRVEESPVTGETLRVFNDSVVSQWNSFCDKHPTFKKVKELSDKRKRSLSLRFKNQSFHAFDAILIALEKQPFLMGQNDRQWTATFDWLIENDNNYVKVIELAYARTNPKTKADTYARVDPLHA